MQKAKDYLVLHGAGLSVPIYDVFDSTCLMPGGAGEKLESCVRRILSEGSGLVGVRTEPKEDSSPLGTYPHYMPLQSLAEVVEAIRENEREWSASSWWYLVNEAFVEYKWNAVVRVTQKGSLPGHWQLDGEVNLEDNVPLRPALTEQMRNVIPVLQWRGADPAGLRKMIVRSGLLEEWIEVSKVSSARGDRIIFWGMRHVT